MKIICIGRNYAAHAAEMKSEVPQEPVYFMKPDTAILPKRNPFYYPDFTTDLHHEVELVLRICKLGKSIHVDHAHKYYDAIGIGIDFTARDVQATCKAKGLPWEKAKAFDHSAPLSEEFIPKEEFEDLNDIGFRLEKNGEVVQDGNTKDLLFNFDQLISYLSGFVTLKIGDLIFTGTPEGVGSVQIGDQLECFIGDRSMLRFNVK